MVNFSGVFTEREPIPGGWRLGVLIGLAVLPGLAAADRGLMMAVRSWSWPPLLDLMQLLTWLGYGAVDIGICLVLGLWGWWRGDRGRVAWVLVGAGTVARAGILDQVLKNLVVAPGPTQPGREFFAAFPVFRPHIPGLVPIRPRDHGLRCGRDRWPCGFPGGRASSRERPCWWGCRA